MLQGGDASEGLVDHLLGCFSGGDEMIRVSPAAEEGVEVEEVVPGVGEDVFGGGAGVDEGEVAVEDLVDPFVVGIAGEELVGVVEEEQVVEAVVEGVEGG